MNKKVPGTGCRLLWKHTNQVEPCQDGICGKVAMTTASQADSFNLIMMAFLLIASSFIQTAEIFHNFSLKARKIETNVLINNKQNHHCFLFCLLLRSSLEEEWKLWAIGSTFFISVPWRHVAAAPPWPSTVKEVRNNGHVGLSICSVTNTSRLFP